MTDGITVRYVGDGPYQPIPVGATAREEVEHVVAHLDGQPCPGCQDAVRILNALKDLLPEDEEEDEDDPRGTAAADAPAAAP